MNKKEISIAKKIITDLIVELRVIDVALYRFSQEATAEYSASPDDVNRKFLALFAKKRINERISSIRTSLVDCLINDGKINEADLDEIDANCTSQLLEDFNIKY